jgi:hypothetical protein
MERCLKVNSIVLAYICISIDEVWMGVTDTLCWEGPF